MIFEVNNTVTYEIKILLDLQRDFFNPIFCLNLQFLIWKTKGLRVKRFVLKSFFNKKFLIFKKSLYLHTENLNNNK
ncbi:hypothetical protein B0A70_14915 [Chryseobacterium piscicola]|uniref:Uncharacterized protein n=1 Tax=Chryseobacterium piscicola TaxID=551459 RepID=A0A2S7KBJ1_9FLAO|nr:hypothetical protein B0A70_14915 [Chryseobacterium piscicola]